MASIEKRGKGSYRLTVELGYDHEGNRIKRRKTVKCKGITEARKELAKFVTEVESGEYITPEKMLFSAFVDEWQENHGNNELGEQTMESYRMYLKNHILPFFGSMRLNEVKPIHVIKFLSEAQRTDGQGELSVGSKQYLYRILRDIFQRAVDWKKIKENPVAAVKKPKAKKGEKKKRAEVYDEDEVRALFAAAQSEPMHWRVFLSLALAAGLRRSELLGIELSKINIEKQEIFIDQAIVRGKNGKPVIKNTKSDASERLISLPSSVTLELKQYIHQLKKERLKSGDDWVEKEHEWLFCNIDGTHFYPTTPSTWWRRFTKRAGVRYIRLHDLRHTSATLLINQGVHAKIISERLGHADIRITMDTYGHALKKADQEAADKLDELFLSEKKQG
ncbi:site-specific integrase [Bacillus sp. PK3_68]|uniref:tyrosine-type recombinase/integrase n=1 Tax=Bacillus sp. PK3_68 TaxID=2027408 RepID=UPI000E75E288|nr:site-specific integrase [Bacillus sp. PK3_68]RJS60158.1 site-specific integrase [Bacillus sp. PK3_68]